MGVGLLWLGSACSPRQPHAALGSLVQPCAALCNLVQPRAAVHSQGQPCAAKGSLVQPRPASCSTPQHPAARNRQEPPCHPGCPRTSAGGPGGGMGHLTCIKNAHRHCSVEMLPNTFQTGVRLKKRQYRSFTCVCQALENHRCCCCAAAS